MFCSILLFFLVYARVGKSFFGSNLIPFIEFVLFLFQLLGRKYRVCLGVHNLRNSTTSDMKLTCQRFLCFLLWIFSNQSNVIIRQFLWLFVISLGTPNVDTSTL